MATLVNGNEIILTGTVGDLYWDDCFTSADVIFALAQVGRDQDVTIRLNSGGGIATEGAAIHAAIAGHKGRKTIVIEGIAASAASVIAMAGDEIVMSLGALMMVHDPSGFTFGTIDDHQLQIRALTALATAMAGVYSERTGKTVAEARADMQAEIWMTPEEAVAGGYADRTLARAANDDAEPEPTAFDYRLFSHPPERLVALADQRAWTKRIRPTAASPAAPIRQKEKPMATDTAGSEPVIPPNPTAALAAAVEGAKPVTDTTSMSRANAAEIVTLCVAGGVPAMAANLITEGVTVAQAKDRIQTVANVSERVALARKVNQSIAADFGTKLLAEGKSPAEISDALLNAICASEEKTSIASHIRPETGAGTESPKPVDLVADMKRRHGGKA